jgi:tRNA dimethylallyltransferase
MKAKIVIVLGPTAVGKTELALELAQSVDGEIVNADSQQVYRYMDIGTGKPSRTDRERVRHHVIDIVNPDGEFNAAVYRQLAVASIDEIQKRGKNVVVCGGTGLYLKALTHGLFLGPGQDPDLRQELEREISANGLASLYQRLIEVDPSVVSSIHPNDRQRVIRALEVHRSTGRPLSQWQREHSFQENPFAVLKIGLLRERAELYDLINRRSEGMIEDGLLDEVRGLISCGYGLDLKPLRSVGYRQLGEVIQGVKELSEALEEMKQETRHLAKRQLTWFRRDEEIQWYHPVTQQREIIAAAKKFLA